MSAGETQFESGCPCPSCGYNLDAATSLGEKPERRPAPGDLSVCVVCGAVLVFGAPPNVREMTAQELRNLEEADPQSLAQVRRIVHIIRTQNYKQACQRVLERVKDWRRANPQAEVLIQWNFSEKVGLIATISQAVKEHYISANDAGLQLLRSLGEWGTKDEPTVFQCQVAIEASGVSGAPKGSA